ncbi:MAG: hypothetical protein ABSD71_14260 [Bacteroidales bacterium]|jgi:hypothetical protein
MKVLTILIVFLSLNIGTLANDSTAYSGGAVDTVIIYPQPHHIPFDSVVAGFKKLRKVSVELVGTVKDGMKKEGVRGYIGKHVGVFISIIIFLVLYLIWLRRRAI